MLQQLQLYIIDSRATSDVQTIRKANSLRFRMSTSRYIALNHLAARNKYPEALGKAPIAGLEINSVAMSHKAFLRSNK